MPKKLRRLSLWKVQYRVDGQLLCTGLEADYYATAAPAFPAERFKEEMARSWDLAEAAIVIVSTEYLGLVYL